MPKLSTFLTEDQKQQVISSLLAAIEACNRAGGNGNWWVSRKEPEARIKLL